MIVTRNLVNPDITYADFDGARQNSYTFDVLSKHIDAYKNLLVNLDCKPGQKILIGCAAGISQTSLIFAAAELGLVITIVDYNRNDRFENKNYIDPKTRLLSPIDYFFVDNKIDTEKVSLLKSISKTIVCILKSFDNREKVYKITDDNKYYPIELDFTPNRNIDASPESVFMVCTSSGTTGTPKIIKHTHKFIFHLLHRNQQFFYDTIGVCVNLQHGSSFATYFLPAISCPNVKKFQNYKIHDLQLGNFTDLDHLMLPYTHLVEQFLFRKKGHDLLNLYTLSYIQPEWKDHIGTDVKNIISFFGSNETSGPVFINQLSDFEFSTIKYTKVDDFYNIAIGPAGELAVTLPYYDNLTISTNDTFSVVDKNFYHTGRNDLIRINGISVDMISYNKICKELLDADIIFDIEKQKIYLAIWSNHDAITDQIEKINQYIHEASKSAHRINKYDLLTYTDFLSGVKLDHEILREYFRNRV